MEKRETPPKFELLDASQQSDLSSFEPTKQGTSMHQGSNGTRARSFPGGEQHSSASVPGALNNSSGDLVNNGNTDPVVANSTAASHVQDYTQAVLPQQAPQLSPWASYVFPPMAVPTYPSSPGLINCSQLNWPCQLNPSAARAFLSPSAQLDPESQPMTMNQQLLGKARNIYDGFEKQLKEIDRHRAMSQYDPTLSYRRLQAAQARDEMRTFIRQVEKQVAIEQSLAHLQGAMVFTPQLNVQAPAYIPQSVMAEQQGKTRPSTANNTVTGAETPDKTQSAAKRKPIPIVPPPGDTRKRAPSKPADRLEASKTFPDGRTSEPKMHVRGTSTDSRLAAAEVANEEIGTRSPSELGGVPDIDVCDTRKENQTESNGIDKDKPALADLHKLWDIELDALRLPEGTVTRVDIENGHWLDVVGVNLQCPPGAKMNEFETKYWAKKPTFTMAMLDRLKRVAKIQDIEKLDEEYLLGQGKASDR